MLLPIQLLLLNLIIILIMVKLKEDGAVPTNKYAIKKAKTAKSKEQSSEEDMLDAAKTETNKSEESSVNPASKTKGKTVVGKEKRTINIEVEDHVLEIAYIVKNNVAIRHFTSLNILNYLVQTGRIKKDGKGNYVKFLWNKFRVSSNGLTNEYYYNEQFFLKALIGAFGQFAASAQDNISIFMDKEGIDKLED